VGGDGVAERRGGGRAHARRALGCPRLLPVPRLPPCVNLPSLLFDLGGEGGVRQRREQHGAGACALSRPRTLPPCPASRGAPRGSRPPSGRPHRPRRPSDRDGGRGTQRARAADGCARRAQEWRWVLRRPRRIEARRSTPPAAHPDAVARMLHPAPPTSPAARLSTAPDGDGYRVLILDGATRDVIAPLLRVADLRRHGVTLHLQLAAERQVGERGERRRGDWARASRRPRPNRRLPTPPPPPPPSTSPAHPRRRRRLLCGRHPRRRGPHRGRRGGGDL